MRADARAACRRVASRVRLPTSRLWRTSAIVVLLALCAACASKVTPVIGCDAAFGIAPDCRFQNPEDIVRVPGTDWLLVSQFGTTDGSRAGSIAGYQPASGRIEELFAVGAFADDRRWGDPSCPPPAVAAFSPHGIDLARRTSGELEVLAVNHGGRESIEFLALETSPEGLGLEWRGCAIGPSNASFNDVAAKSDGGFWVTKMMGKRMQTLALIEALLGIDTGVVYEWSRERGFVEAPGTRSALPNGVTASRDERYLYVATANGGGEVRKIDRESGAIVARHAVSKPDNFSWADDGRLIVASHADSIWELAACRRVPRGACGAAFEVLALDPDSLEGMAWLAHRGAPIGGVSVAVELGDSLYLGSFAGDRIARWRIPSAGASEPQIGNSEQRGDRP